MDLVKRKVPEPRHQLLKDKGLTKESGWRPFLRMTWTHRRKFKLMMIWTLIDELFYVVFLDMSHFMYLTWTWSCVLCCGY